MERKRIFMEDDCLQHDSTYPGIRGWWKEKFPGRDFYKDYSSVESTEVDHGDSFERKIILDDIVYEIWHSFDGYSVFQQV